MSLFNKRRKISRKQQEIDNKIKEEHSKQFDKGINNILKTTEIIKNEHPEFESLDSKEKIKLFGKIFDTVSEK